MEQCPVKRFSRSELFLFRHDDFILRDGIVGVILIFRRNRTNPQVIAVDEITVREDIAAMAAAAHCGVRFLAPIHADGRQELGRKPLFSQLLKARVFEKAVTIRREGEQRQYIVEELW